MTRKRVPFIFLPWGYYAILSEKQRAELSEMMQRAYEAGASDDARVYWLEVEAGEIEDRWAIFIDGVSRSSRVITGMEY